MRDVMERGWGRRLAAILLAVIVGCAGARRPGQAPGPQPPTALGARRPVILIPGLLGTRLEDRTTHRVVWGGVRGFFGGATAHALALPLDPGEADRLEPAGLVAEVAGLDVYESILKALRERGGYVPATDPPATRSAYFVFDYDWRQSCATIAAALDRKIRAIQALYGDPDLKVDIVAHSMGGLVARYYLLYGGRDVRDEAHPVPDFAGARNVGTLVLLATPNLGSVGALKACIEGRTLFLTTIPPEVFATGPSMYELLPSPSVPALVTADGRPAGLDIYDAETWRRLEWGIFDPRLVAGIRQRYRERHPGVTAGDVDAHMGRLYATFARLLREAAGFYRAIEAAPLPGEVTTLLIGSDCMRTLKALVVEQEGGRLVTRFAPDQVRGRVPGVDLKGLFFGPGDGQVTVASLLGTPVETAAGMPGPRTPLAAAEAVFVCAHHTTIVRNPVFEQALVRALRGEDRPQGGAPAPAAATGR